MIERTRSTEQQLKFTKTVQELFSQEMGLSFCAIFTAAVPQTVPGITRSMNYRYNEEILQLQNKKIFEF
jgi:hypothetical protein